MTEQTHSKLNLHNAELSDRLQKALSVNKTGEVTVPENLFIDNRPESLTPENLKDAATYVGHFIPAFAHALGTVALPAITKHAAIETVRAAVPMMGKDVLEVKVHREKEFPNPSAGGEKIKKYGVVEAKIDIHEGDGSKGQLKIVRQEIAEAYKAALMSKVNA